MQKPTEAQLQKMYPNASTEYISDNIDRKIALIQAEDSVIEQIDKLINQFQEQIIGVMLLQTVDKNKLVQSKLADLEFQIANIEVDAIVQLYETSGYLYQWLIEKYFGDVPTQEIGGEQNTVVKRKKLIKRDIQKMVEHTVTRNQNIGSSVNGALKSLQNDIKTLNSGNVNDINKAFKKVKSKVAESTRSVLQQVVYDAETNTNIHVSDNYQIVFYRVEVLDSDICMNCLQIDGSINNDRLGLLHKKCRGIDVALLKDLETGKYYDTSHKGYGHKLKTKTFEQKFESLSEKQKRRMLGKSNYELYSSGQLSASDFIANGRQITNAEAKIKSELNALRKSIDTPRKASNIANYMESMFGKPISKMSSEELLAYEKCLGLQKQLYENVPKKAYPKSRPMQSYIDDIDAKYDEINKIRKIRNKKGVK